MNASVISIIRKFMPRRMIVTLRLQKIFFDDYAHNRRIEGMPVDNNGKYQPWLVYPMIEYLDGLDLSDKDVFEFGAGASTMYFSAKARNVISVEFDKGWYEILKNKVPDNVTLFHEQDGHSYASSAEKFSRKFDVVIVDGAERYRSALTAINVVSDDGMIILDNAEWYPNTSELLLNAGFIEIRFSGFSPINAFTSTSTMFIKKDFKFKNTTISRLPPKGGKRVDALDDKLTQ